MKISYYPGCTLKTKAAGLESSALAILRHLDVEVEELKRWNCCGAVYSLADDDLIHHVASVRNLIRAAQLGSDTVVTLCSQCYNTLVRANLMVRTDEEKRDTINRFMDEEPDYAGEVEVLHFLDFLKENIGWDALREKISNPLTGMKVAPFYGCALVRPAEVRVGGPRGKLLDEFIEVIGAEAVSFPEGTECCGSYQGLAHPEAGMTCSSNVVKAAFLAGADAMILSCPLCEYNLGSKQPQVLQGLEGVDGVPTFYFTQLLAVALGLEIETCRFELNSPAALEFLKSRELVVSA